ncbi:uncharacterized protein MONBRDRAFT_33347 [Monosiga brevicollis MX1]|uniref:Ubiquitin carboxyl-terminal hydrolase n=1 Tax=Monosiga brevicollis TaxID=81824 RepID=A9V4W3_MONBE|nr:uncharacterized protein MONBRDRAFT_33347 [Monosiga brevicollis MX1]EDQ87525.1 predicted protein [Monosiga brevicollis MX1]|eukprot:XP_001747785.1 hypothetical protein [Monosiga brevicollis MX1]
MARQVSVASAGDAGLLGPAGIPQHGCVHASDYKTVHDDRKAPGRELFARALSYTWLHSRSQHTCTACSDLDAHHVEPAFNGQRDLHLCLSCVFIGCFTFSQPNGEPPARHSHEHAVQASHALSLSLAHRRVYCHFCNDFIYDPDFEHWIDTHTVMEMEDPHAADPERFAKQPWSLDINTDAGLQAAESLQARAVLSTRYTPGLGLRGLCNLGNTCFVNSILQALIHNPLLRNFFLADMHRQSPRCLRLHEPQDFNIGSRIEARSSDGSFQPATIRGVNPDNSYAVEWDDGSVQEVMPRKSIRSMADATTVPCLACVLAQLFSDAYNGQHEQMSTHTLLYAIWKASSHLAGYSQQDSHEFFISLLDGLHQHMVQEGVNPHSNAHDCDCIIHRVFTGKLQSDVSCQSCGFVSTTFEPFWDLSLGIRRAATGDGQSEQLGEDAMVTCTNCKAKQQAHKRLTLHSLPVALCFHLKRFRQASFTAPIVKDQVYVRFSQELDLYPYLAHAIATTKDEQGASRPSLRDDAFTYNLFAVITHIGTMQQGHYIAHVKHGGQWYCCDDGNVFMVHERDVLQTQAYMLFYIKTRLEYGTPSKDGP